MPDEYESPQTPAGQPVLHNRSRPSVLRFRFSQGSRNASLVLQAETIFPAAQSTAPSLMMPSSPNSAPRRGPGMAERRTQGQELADMDQQQGTVVDCLAFWNENHALAV